MSLAVSLAVSESVPSSVSQAARKAVWRQLRKPFGGSWQQRGKPLGGRWRQRGKPFGGCWRQRGKLFGGSSESAWGRAGWRWLGVSASRHIAALAAGGLAHTFGARSFFMVRLVCQGPGARAARCPPWRPFFSGFGWSFIVQLFFVGSAGCSWPPGRPAGCTAPPRSFF